MTHHAIELSAPRPMKEINLHKYVVQLLRMNAATGLVWAHVPNGEARSPATGAKLKAMGVRPGYADFALVIPGAGRSAFLELKSDKGRTSKEQRAFREDVEAAGALYAIARTPEEAQDILGSWGALRRSMRPSDIRKLEDAE